MDRRQKKTSEAIIQAFVGLLKKKSYEKVSVKDIIEAADIGRSTFYDHFETKDELAIQVCFNLFHHIFSPVGKACATHDFTTVNIDSFDRLTHILYHLRDKREYYAGILKYNNGELFQVAFRRFVTQHIHIDEKLKQSSSLDKVPDTLLVTILSVSLLGLIEWWLKEKMQINPEESIQHFSSIVNPELMSIWSLEDSHGERSSS